MPARRDNHAMANEFGSRSALDAGPQNSRSVPRSASSARLLNGRPRHCSVATASTPGTSSNRLATERRAATTRRAVAKWRRTSAIAGSAITASPSQFGANTQTVGESAVNPRLGKDDLVAGSLRAVAPPPVHPQPQLGIPPHIHLEHVGASLREFPDRLRRVVTRGLDWVVVDEPIPSALDRKSE